MKLRAAVLIPTLTLGLLAAPMPADARKAEKVYRIGFLLGWSAPSAGSTSRGAAIDALLQGLQDLGYRVGQHVAVEYRYAQGRFDRLPELAAELVRLKVDVMITVGATPTLAAKRATQTIPIVMVHAANPVASGLVASLARPGGNITGTSSRREGFAGKWLQLITEAVPKVSRVAVLWNPANPVLPRLFREVQVAARALRVELQSLEARQQEEFKGAFDALAAGRAGALVVFPGLIVGRHGRRILDLVAKSRVAAIYPYRQFVDRGGLMFYGPTVQSSARRAAAFVDKILKGAKPADLPVEQPTKFQLVINLKTAKALGITFPESILIRADEIIE